MSVIIKSEDFVEAVRWLAPTLKDSSSHSLSDKENSENHSDDVNLNDLSEDDMAALQPPTLEEIQAIEEAAHEEGFQRGYADGLKKGLAAGQANMDRVTDQLAQILNNFSLPLARLENDVVMALSELSAHIAEHIVRHAYRVQPELLETVVNVAVDTAGRHQRDIEVHIHPDDYKVLHSLLSFSGDTRLLPDSQLKRGDVRVHAEAVRIDATIQAQISSALDTILQEATLQAVHSIPPLAKQSTAGKVSDAESISDADNLSGAARASGDKSFSEAESVSGSENISDAENLSGVERNFNAESVAGVGRVSGAENVSGAGRVSDVENVSGAGRVSGAENISGAERVYDVETLSAAETTSNAERFSNTDSTSEINADKSAADIPLHNKKQESNRYSDIEMELEFNEEWSDEHEPISYLVEEEHPIPIKTQQSAKPTDETIEVVEEQSIPTPPPNIPTKSNNSFQNLNQLHLNPPPSPTS